MREDFQRRHDIPEEDLDDVLAIAQELQSQAEKEKSDTISRGEIEAVASELSVEKEFIDKAIAKLKLQRDVERAQRQEREVARGRLLTRAVTVAAAILVGLTALGGVGAVGVNAAAQRAQGAESTLNVVIDRQVALLPQLVALSGGEPGSLRVYEARLKDADTVSERLEAARALSNAMAAKVGKLPPGDRQSLQYEIVGAQNRITVEQRRYQEALGAWRSAASSPQGKLAVSLGWAEAPPAK